jgi:hypothetical protein
LRFCWGEYVGLACGLCIVGSLEPAS